MPILTFQDALKLMQDYTGGTSFSRNLADIKQAIRMALSGLYRDHVWTYYRTMWSFGTVDSFSTGTMAYSHAGGYTVTISGGNIADRFRSSQRGAILASSIVGEVDRFTTTTAIMDETLNWGQAVAASTTYTLFQDHFPLPKGFRNLNVTVRADNGNMLKYLAPEQFVYRRSFTAQTGEPTTYTIMADPKVIGQYAIYLYPAPSSLAMYRVQYTRAYDEPKITGDETASSAGTVTISAGSRYGTGSGTSFSNGSHKGAVIRFGDTSNVPTDWNGNYPFVEEAVIANCSSTTAFELRTVTTNAFSAVKYQLADPIDISPDMYDAFIKRCRLEVAQLRPDTKSKELPMAIAAYEEALQIARGGDTKEHSVRVTGGVPYYYNLKNSPTGEDLD